MGTHQDEASVAFNSKKRIRLLLLGVGLALFGIIAGSCLLYFQPGRRWLVCGLLLMLGGGFGVFMVVGITRTLLSKKQVGLVLNASGLVFAGTPIAKKIGLILWQDIEYLSTGMAYGSRFVFLHLKDTGKYMCRLPSSMQQLVGGGRVGISSDELSIEFDELQRLIETYFNRYKSS